MTVGVAVVIAVGSYCSSVVDSVVDSVVAGVFWRWNLFETGRKMLLSVSGG